MTCLEFAGDSTLYIGTNTGHMTAWDTRKNFCFLHWQADLSEIGMTQYIITVVCEKLS